MRQSPTTEIQQQMYTRERRGIFRLNEGYDTIAASIGLDGSFIKKVLHPFCVYDVPTELIATGEKDDELYPEAFHLFHTEQGAIVYGRSIYQAKDFTGLRSAFFTHNYVVPKGQAEGIVHHYAQWFRTSFADHYNIEQGTELPELESLPVYSGTAYTQTAKERLAALKIDERIFKQLLYATMMSASGKKKVYISLDVPIEQISMYARELLEILFDSLPYAYRRLLGFMTYVKDLQSKKGINLMFVEKGGLRSNDRNIEKEFTFDLATGRVANIDVELPNQPYLEFAWSNLDQPERAEKFYQYADQMLADMDPVRQAAMMSYHELCVYFQIEEGQMVLYDLNKVTVLRGMLDYFHPPGAFQAKPRLNELFVTLLDYEFDQVKRGQQLEPAVAECLKDYYRISGGKHEGQLITTFIYAINQSIAAKDEQRTTALYAVLQKSPGLSKVFFDTVLDRGMAAALFDPYMKEQFHKADRAGDVIDLVCEWGSQHMQVLNHAAFLHMAQQALLDKLRPERDPVTVANAILEQLSCLPRTRWEDAELADSKLIDTLAYTANLFLLTEVDLEQIRKEQLLKIGFLKMPDEVGAWVQRFSPEVRSRAAVMLAAYQWFTMPKPDETVFEGLTAEEFEYVQKLGRGWLRHEIHPSQFERIVIAFYRDVESQVVEYGALLQFLHSNVSNKEIVYQFMTWSEGNRSFVRSNKPSPAYAAAIITYFKKLDRDAFKKRAIRKQYFEVNGSALRSVYDRVRRELSSPLVQLLSRNKRVWVMLVLLIVVAGGGWYGLQAAGILGKGETSTVANPEASAGEQAADQQLNGVRPIITASYVNKVVDEQEKEVTQLAFDFPNAQICADFHLSLLTIVYNNNQTEDIGAADFELLPKACAVDSSQTDTASQEPAASTDSQEETDPSQDASASADDSPSGQLSAMNQVVIQLKMKVELESLKSIRLGSLEYPVLKSSSSSSSTDADASETGEATSNTSTGTDGE